MQEVVEPCNILTLCPFLLFQFGFNMIIEHLEAINSIALSLNHKSLR